MIISILYASILIVVTALIAHYHTDHYAYICITSYYLALHTKPLQEMINNLCAWGSKYRQRRQMAAMIRYKCD